MVRGLSDLQVGCMNSWALPVPPVVPLFPCGGWGDSPWNMFPPLSFFPDEGFLQPLLGIWKSLENLKKKILKSLSIAPQPWGATAKKKGRGSGGQSRKSEEKQS